MTPRTLRLRLAAAAAAVALAAGPAAAAPGHAALFGRSAVSRYWSNFKEYWAGAFRSQGAVTLVVLGAGAVSMFIITRGKWKK